MQSICKLKKNSPPRISHMKAIFLSFIVKVWLDSSDRKSSASRSTRAA